MRAPRAWTPPAKSAVAQIRDGVSHDRAILLAGSGSAAVRYALAMERSTPIGILIHLSRDAHPAVRAAVAAHPAVVLSAATMRRLEHDPERAVREALASNTVRTADAPAQSDRRRTPVAA